jgi:surfactin synthase thioesterase subunit
MVTFFGTADRRIKEHMVRGWQKFTRKPFSIHAIEGNHLFPLQKEQKLEWLLKIVQGLEGLQL